MARNLDFYKRVGMVCREIPSGKVATYGQVALLCGKPRNARQVGYALRTDKAGKVPAHRVVDSRGYLSGAGAFPTHDMQRRLLESEGVRVSADAQVELERYGWRNTLELAISLRERFETDGV